MKHVHKRPGQIASASWEPGKNTLEVRYGIEVCADSVRLPDPRPAPRAQGVWKRALPKLQKKRPLMWPDHPFYLYPELIKRMDPNLVG